MGEVGVGCQINTLMLVEVSLQMQLHSLFQQNLGEGRRNGKYEPSWLNSLVASYLAAMKSCCVRQVCVPMGITA